MSRCKRMLIDSETAPPVDIDELSRPYGSLTDDELIAGIDDLASLDVDAMLVTLNAELASRGIAWRADSLHDGWPAEYHDQISAIVDAIVDAAFGFSPEQFRQN